MSRLKKAMQRAQSLRNEADKVQKRSEAKSEPSSAEAAPEPKQKEVKVNYSKTRVQRIDRDLLRKNKIFSLFKEQRTTDEIERLRTQVLAQLKKTGGNTLMVTSAHPGEGKTFTSINLGISIAKQLDKTVLLVDCDLRNPWRHHFDFATDFFGLTIREGLADYLIKGTKLEKILINPGIEKLTLLPGGRPVPNSSELLGSKKMETLINDLKDRYHKDRIVIFDCPAMLACTDPLVFSHLIDGIILVVEAERTNPEELKRVVELLNDRPLLGTILNKSKDQRESYV
jgi:non-specific protein-tyrosine kinase